MNGGSPIAVRPERNIESKSTPPAIPSVRCDEAAVDGRNGVDVEREANEFAAALLMPVCTENRTFSRSKRESANRAQ